MSHYISQTITVGSCQSDISNQCGIKTPSITGMAQTREGGGGGGTRPRGEGGGGYKVCGIRKGAIWRKRGADCEMPLQNLVPNSQTVAQEEARTVTSGGSLRWAFGWLRLFGGGFGGLLSVPGGFWGVGVGDNGKAHAKSAKSDPSKSGFGPSNTAA